MIAMALQWPTQLHSRVAPGRAGDYLGAWTTKQGCSVSVDAILTRRADPIVNRGGSRLLDVRVDLNFLQAHEPCVVRFKLRSAGVAPAAWGQFML